MRIEDIDKNFKPQGLPEGVELEFFDVREAPFKVWGLMYEDDSFCRMPDAVAKATSGGVYALHEHCAGGRVTFETNSKYVAIVCRVRSIGKMAHFTTIGSAGFDMYEENNFVCSFFPPYDYNGGYDKSYSFDGEPKSRKLLINFPLYTAVESLMIGIEKGAILSAYNPYRDIPPIVYYGSSITQGGCASRPGNAYQAKLSRELLVDHINLGFSGSAKGEVVMAEYIASLPMSAFVMDYDHNAGLQHLAETHERFYKIIREKNPDLPIIFASAPDFWRHSEAAMRDKQLRRREILNTYVKCCQEDENLYFVDGASFYQNTDSDYCSVDGCHPNDMGFYYMAKGFLPTLRKVLK